ncbi:MAG: flippase-like domain-containing protein [Nanoarchaeota archaeon]|nr:flippase-like domain-containing protein [Nanoarchaeota archaeon]
MRWLKKILILLFLLGLLFFVASKVDVHRLTEQVYHIQALPVIIMVLLFVVSFLLWNLRWYVSLRVLGRVSFWRLLPVLMAGMFVNNVTPFAGLGGEPLRAFYAQKLMRKPGTKVFSLTIVEKLFGTVIMALLLIFSLLFVVINLMEFPVLRGVALMLLIFFLGAIVIFSLLLGRVSLRKLLFVDVLLIFIYFFRPFSQYLRAFVSREHFLSSMHQEIDRAKKFLGRWLCNKRFVVINSLLTLVLTVITYLTVYYGFVAIGLPVSFFTVIVVYTLATIVADLSFIPGGVGLLEVVNIGLLNAFGVPLEAAAVVTILNRVVYYFFALGVGYFCLVYLHLKE